MAEAVYVSCAVTAALCALFLLKSYRAGRQQRLLLWAALCFACLTVSNIVLFVDMVILPNVDFHGPLLRSAMTSVGGSLLLMGLIWELT